jgi:hypothetical protein
MLVTPAFSSRNRMRSLLSEHLHTPVHASSSDDARTSREHQMLRPFHFLIDGETMGDSSHMYGTRIRLKAMYSSPPPTLLFFFFLSFQIFVLLLHLLAPSFQ